MGNAVHGSARALQVQSLPASMVTADSEFTWNFWRLSSSLLITG